MSKSETRTWYRLFDKSSGNTYGFYKDDMSAIRDAQAFYIGAVIEALDEESVLADINKLVQKKNDNEIYQPYYNKYVEYYRASEKIAKVGLLNATELEFEKLENARKSLKGC